ncbi:MAG: nucleotidyl transferase AbiEii/AbiGii toxin family protein [Methanomassiliicoccales archaeon]|nr:nucleotidyl transferase AbiEii/AbiGii toxin family protein [Methanomassiliicoccales archaeon]
MQRTSYDHFGQDVREKMSRLFEILNRIYSVEFLSRRLSFYGGTALHSIHFDLAERLSIDLDFNFRQVGDEDWGEQRDEVDSRIKSILDSLGYLDYRIQPSYPLNRFDIKYRSSSGLRDSIKIEIGYLRRVPFSRDINYSISNEYTNNLICLSPMKEELLANKIVTFFSRGGGRDLYDVYAISRASYNEEWMRKLVLLESVAILSDSIFESNIHALVNGVRIDTTLTSLLPITSVPEDIKNSVQAFLQEIIDATSVEEREFIKRFYGSGDFEPELLEFELFNSEARFHSSVLWNLSRLGVLDSGSGSI